MPIERKPLAPVSASYAPPGSIKYRVQDDDDWARIARHVGMPDAPTLIEYNFKTRSPAEVNWYLRNYVGCNKATRDGRNWTFSSSADPGVIHVPDSSGPAGVGAGGTLLDDGETIHTMAYAAGHRWQTVWEADENRNLRELRKQPERVRPGDHVHVPPLRAKLERIGTGRVHRFQRLGTKDAAGVLILYTDIRIGEVASAEDRFTLSGSAGYRTSRVAKEDHVIHHDHVAFVFAGLSLVEKYSLAATATGGEETRVFVDLALAEIDDLDVADDPGRATTSGRGAG